MAYSYKVWISWGWVDFGVAYGWSHICSLGKHIKSGWNSFAQFSKWVVIQGFVFGVNAGVVMILGYFSELVLCSSRQRDYDGYLHIHYGGVFWDVVLNRACQDWALEILQSFIAQLYSV